MVYPFKIDNRNASREYVMGTINDTIFKPEGRSAMGKTAPPKRELNEPKIKPKGSPCLNIIVPAAEQIPKLIKITIERV